MLPSYLALHGADVLHRGPDAPCYRWAADIPMGARTNIRVASEDP